MYRPELKRLIKSRSTLFLAAAALTASVFFACVTVAGAGSIGRGYITLHGVEAIEYHRELYAEAEGFVTPERIDAMVRFSEAARAEYGPVSEMPEKIYAKWISSEPVLSAVKIYGAGWEPDEYYQWRKDAIDAITSSFSNGAIRDTALALDSRVEEPFYWEYGFGSSEAQVNWSLLLFALCLTGVVMASPCFSQGYATGADSIMRCARHGRGRLFAAKAAAAYTVCAAVYLLCAGTFWGILLLTFGPDSSAAQLKMDPTLPLNLSMNGVLALCLLSGLLTLLASVSLTLLLSSVQASSLAVLVISAAALALPMFAGRYIAYPAGDWLRLLLPGGGTGLLSSMYYELSDVRYLALGSVVLITPFVMLAAPAIEAPVFALLARRAYVRHECA